MQAEASIKINKKSIEKGVMQKSRNKLVMNRL